MTKTRKALTALAVASAFFIGVVAFHAPIEAYAAQLYHTSFDQTSPTFSGISSVDGSGEEIITVSDLNRQYLSLVNSGSNGVSCFPASSISGKTYGGGWYLVANGGAISFDGVSIYGGTVSCITGGSATTVGVVYR